MNFFLKLVVQTLFEAIWDCKTMGCEKIFQKFFLMNLMNHNISLFSSFLAYYVAQQTNLAHISSTISFLSQGMCMTKDFSKPSKSAEEDRKLIFSQ